MGRVFMTYPGEEPEVGGRAPSEPESGEEHENAHEDFAAAGATSHLPDAQDESAERKRNVYFKELFVALAKIAY